MQSRDLPASQRAQMTFERIEPESSTPDAPTPSRWPRLRANAKMLASLLLGGAAILLAIIAVRSGLTPMVDGMFHPGEQWLSAIRRVGIFVAATAAYWAYVRWFEKRPATELQLRLKPLLLGAVAGVGLVGIPIALLFAFDAYEALLFRGFSPALLGVAGLIVVAAALEELVYRALLFRLTERTWGTVAALVVQALLFAAQHLENLSQGSATDVLALMVSVALLGLLWASIFVLTRNLWAGVANHATWNFTILLSGVPLSGIEDWRALAPLESRYAGPDGLTGGQFGPESSLLVIVCVTIAVVWLLRTARRRGRFRGAFQSAPDTRLETESGKA